MFKASSSWRSSCPAPFALFNVLNSWHRIKRLVTSGRCSWAIWVEVPSSESVWPCWLNIFRGIQGDKKSLALWRASEESHGFCIGMRNVWGVFCFCSCKCHRPPHKSQWTFIIHPTPRQSIKIHIPHKLVCLVLVCVCVTDGRDRKTGQLQIH